MNIQDITDLSQYFLSNFAKFQDDISLFIEM